MNLSVMDIDRNLIISLFVATPTPVLLWCSFHIIERTKKES